MKIFEKIFSGFHRVQIDYPEVNQLVSIKREGVVAADTQARIFTHEPSGLIWIQCSPGAGLIRSNLGEMVVLEYPRKNILYRVQCLLESANTSTDGMGRPVLLFGMRPTSEIQKIQRRGFRRYPIDESVAFRNILIPEGFGSNPTLTRQMLQMWSTTSAGVIHFGRIRDMSGSGIGFVSNAPLSRNDGIYLEFAIAKAPFQLGALVVRQIRVSANSLFGARFLGLTEPQRAQLIQLLDRIAPLTETSSQER